MTITVWTVLRGFAGLERGRWCRGCQEPISRDDEFGASEGVCRACRGTAEPPQVLDLAA